MYVALLLCGVDVSVLTLAYRTEMHNATVGKQADCKW